MVTLSAALETAKNRNYDSALYLCGCLRNNDNFESSDGSAVV